jgi:hypothetical protein
MTNAGDATSKTHYWTPGVLRAADSLRYHGEIFPSRQRWINFLADEEDVLVNTRSMNLISTSSRRGVAMLYVVIFMTALVGIASFAVDYSRVQLAKTQLRTATDAAARYSVKWISGGQATTLQMANAAASDNAVNGSTLTINSADLVLGNWNTATRKFTANGVPKNAVKIHSVVAVPLLFGGVIGIRSCNIHADAIGSCIPAGFIGFTAVDFKNNTYVASYDSSVKTNPSKGNSNDNATLASNGSIGAQNNGDLHGDAFIGAGGTIASGWTITGKTETLTAPIPMPADPAWNPTGNPGGVPAAFTVNAVTTVPGGTYWFTSLTVNNALKLAGPAVLYVNGNIDIGANITTYNSIPSNLTIYQLGTGRTFTIGGQIVAKVIAPGSDFVTKNNFNYDGSGMFNSITVKNNGEFYFDEQIGSAIGVTLVQ